MLLRYSFGPRPNDRALTTAGSAMTIGLSIKGFSHPKNQYDERQQDWLDQDIGLRRPARLDAIQACADPPFLPLAQENKRRLCSQGVITVDKEENKKLDLKKKCFSVSICWSRRGAQRSSHVWYKMRSRWLELQGKNCIWYTRQIHFKTVGCDFSLSLLTYLFTELLT